MPVDESKRDFAIAVVRQLREAGYVALWAGGCVRDLLMGREPGDYDVATSATPGDVRNVFGRRRTLAVGESFGVIIVLGPPPAKMSVEVATFRTESSYADGRRPDRVEFSTPEEDAQRRDFTINGMFYDPLAEEVKDYVGGETDLRAGLIRAIGDPRDRMSEDKLRMLRGVRFTATLDFELDPTTADAIREMAGELTVVSWERISQELRKMLLSPHRRRAMRLCEQLGLLEAILPELRPLIDNAENPEWTRTLNALEALQQPRFELAAAVLLHTLPAPADNRRRRDSPHGTVADVCRRLKLSNDEIADVTWLVREQHALDDAPALPVARLKRLLSDSRSGDLQAMARSRAAADNRPTPALDFVDDYVRRTPAEVISPPPFVTGDQLIELGGRPGPAFKRILNQVRDAQLECAVSSPDEAVALARSLLASLEARSVSEGE